MTAFEWFKHEARNMGSIDAKITFASDIIIHAKEPSMLRLARKYHGLLCHIDEVQQRASKALVHKTLL